MRSAVLSQQMAGVDCKWGHSQAYAWQNDIAFFANKSEL